MCKKTVPLLNRTSIVHRKSSFVHFEAPLWGFFFIFFSFYLHICEKCSTFVPDLMFNKSN